MIPHTPELESRAQRLYYIYCSHQKTALPTWGSIRSSPDSAALNMWLSLAAHNSSANAETRPVLQAALAYLRNKSAAIFVLVLLMWLYGMAPADAPLPFANLMYGSIIIMAQVVGAPAIRLMVFGEVAHYAECGQLLKDLKTGIVTPDLRHYWFGTTVCYITSLIATLAAAL